MRHLRHGQWRAAAPGTGRVAAGRHRIASCPQTASATWPSNHVSVCVTSTAEAVTLCCFCQNAVHAARQLAQAVCVQTMVLQVSAEATFVHSATSCCRCTADRSGFCEYHWAVNPFQWQQRALGHRFRSKAPNSSYSKALLISTMRSARKLNSTCSGAEVMTSRCVTSESKTHDGIGLDLF